MVELGLDSAVGGKTKGSRSGENGDDLPEHGIRSGDIVGVKEQVAGGVRKGVIKEKERSGVKGVVTRVGDRAIWVAVDGGDEGGKGEDGDGLDWGKRVWVVKLADEVTFKRYVMFFSHF